MNKCPPKEVMPERDKKEEKTKHKKTGREETHERREGRK